MILFGGGSTDNYCTFARILGVPLLCGCSSAFVTGEQRMVKYYNKSMMAYTEVHMDMCMRMVSFGSRIEVREDRCIMSMISLFVG